MTSIRCFFFWDEEKENAVELKESAVWRLKKRNSEEIFESFFFQPTKDAPDNFIMSDVLGPLFCCSR